jgi:hypothetical protein
VEAWFNVKVRDAPDLAVEAELYTFIVGTPLRRTIAVPPQDRQFEADPR